MKDDFDEIGAADVHVFDRSSAELMQTIAHAIASETSEKHIPPSDIEALITAFFAGFPSDEVTFTVNDLNRIIDWARGAIVTYALWELVKKGELTIRLSEDDLSFARRVVD